MDDPVPTGESRGRRSGPGGRTGEVVFGPGIDRVAIGLHDGARFAGRFFTEVVGPPYHVGELVSQCLAVGVRSLPLISVTGFVVGIVFTTQSRPSLASFGATSWLPSLVTIAIVRALAPLVTALICAGRIGSSIGAELGSMKVSEQIEAMEVSAINPFKYLVVTRTLATTLMLPVLMLYCGIISLTGSFLNVHVNELTSLPVFLQNGFSTISFLDLGASVVRSIIFGFTIGIISCYQGFHATAGTRGVGRAANASVVISMFVIFFEEILSVQVVTSLRGL